MPKPSDLASTEMGTFYSHCVPEPDGYITTGFNRAIAYGIARLTSCGIFVQSQRQTYPTGNGTYSFGSISKFTKLPLVKIWVGSSGVFSDKLVVGTGCSESDEYPEGIVWAQLNPEPSSDNVIMHWDPDPSHYPGGAESMGTFTVYGYGR